MQWRMRAPCPYILLDVNLGVQYNALINWDRKV